MIACDKAVDSMCDKAVVAVARTAGLAAVRACREGGRHYVTKVPSGAARVASKTRRTGSLEGPKRQEW